MADGLLNELDAVFGFERWLLSYYDREAHQIRLLASKGLPKDVEQELRSADSSILASFESAVISAGLPYFSPSGDRDASEAAAWRKHFQLRGPLLAYPLMAGPVVAGLLVVNDPELRSEQRELLSPFVHQLATAIVLYRRLTRRDSLLGLIQNALNDMAHAPVAEDWLLHVLASRVKDAMGVDRCAVYRVSRRFSRPLVYKRCVAVGYPNPDDSDERSPACGDRADLVNQVLDGKLILADTAEDSSWEGPVEDGAPVTHSSELWSFLGAPLFRRLSDQSQQTVGAVVLMRKRTNKHDDRGLGATDRVLLTTFATALSTLLMLLDARNQLDEQRQALRGLSEFSRRLRLHAEKPDPPLMPTDPLRSPASEGAVGPRPSSQLLNGIVVEATSQPLQADIAILYPYATDCAKFLVPPAIGGTRESKDLPCLDQVLQSMERRCELYYEENTGNLHSEGAGDLRTAFQPLAMQEKLVAFVGLPLIPPIPGTDVALQHPTGPLLGFMIVGYRRPRPFSDTDKRTLETIASYVALALNNDRAILRGRQMQARQKEMEECYSKLARCLRNLGEALKDAEQVQKVVRTVGHLNASQFPAVLPRVSQRSEEE